MLRATLSQSLVERQAATVLADNLKGSSLGLLCLLQVYMEIYIRVQVCFGRGENALFGHAFLLCVSSRLLGAVSGAPGNGMRRKIHTSTVAPLVLTAAHHLCL